MNFCAFCFRKIVQKVTTKIDKFITGTQSSFIQNLLEYFSGTVISVFFVPLSLGVFPVIFVLK